MPVIFPATQAVEGAILIDIPIEAIMTSRIRTSQVEIVERPAATAGAKNSEFEDVEIQADEVRVSLQLDEPMNALHLAVRSTIDRAGIDESITALSIRSSVVGLGLTGLIVIVSILAARRLLRPLRDLADATGRVVTAESYAKGVSTAAAAVKSPPWASRSTP